ncbi:hypothetical protein BD413DRAFT_462632, partial [Trametes elegans]
MQSQLTILRTYALMDPEEIPDSVKLWYSEDTVTIHDKYPKGLYHELVLPLIRPPLRAADLKDLRSLLLLPREQAKGVLLKLRRDALETKRLIEQEMVIQHTATWPVHIGVHALPSLEHLHVHVVSSDFLGEYFKRKKNLNSFHPKLGFFIHLDEIIRWFDADIEPTWFAMVSTIDKKEYEPLLRANTRCPLCDAPYTSSPRLRRHLEEHFEATKAAEHQRRVQEMIDAMPDEPEPAQ